MSELFFVLKSLMLTAALTMLLQLKWGGITVENRAENWLTHSSTAVWIQGVAAGGALAVTNVVRSVKDAVASSTDSFQDGAREQRAGR